MKKTILLLTLTLLSFSCSKDDNNSGGSNSNGNATNGNVDYFFNININGVEHKVQGNTSSIGSNVCGAFISTTTTVMFSIADITKPNFVNGQNLIMYLFIPNCHIGQNQATVFINSPVYDTFKSNLPNSFGNGFQQYSGIYSNPNINYSTVININITDMGTSLNSSTLPLSYGNTLKGNFTGPVYFPSTRTPSVGPFNYDIPMQLDISFSAYRTN